MLATFAKKTRNDHSLPSRERVASGEHGLDFFQGSSLGLMERKECMISTE